MNQKKYRVNETENFNLHSMYEHLKVMEIEMQEGSRPWDDGIIDRIAEVENLLDLAPYIGSRVDWPTLKRIREIKEERQLIRYQRCIEAGKAEYAGNAFEI